MEVNQLVKMARNGNKEAFAGLYEAHFDSLYIFVRAKVDGAERAEDICADTFVKAFEKLASFSGKSSFKTWLYTIARNMVNDWYRSKGNRKFLSLQNIFPALEFKFSVDEPEVDQLSKEKVLDENGAEVAEILQKIPEKYAEVLRLRFLADLTIRETAEVLDTTENNVKVMQNRAIKKAQEAIISDK